MPGSQEDIPQTKEPSNEAVGPTGPTGPEQSLPPRGVLGATGPDDQNLQTEVPGPERLQQDMALLRKDIEGVKEKLERESFSAILAIGVFASVITFLSVQIQILGKAANIYELAFLSLLTLAGLLAFLLFIFALVYIPKKWVLWWVVGTIILILLFGSWRFALKIPTLGSDTFKEETVVKPVPQDKFENQTAAKDNQASSSTDVQN